MSSPKSQFKSIKYLVLGLLYGLTQGHLEEFFNLFKTSVSSLVKWGKWNYLFLRHVVKLNEIMNLKCLVWFLAQLIPEEMSATIVKNKGISKIKRQGFFLTDFLHMIQCSPLSSSKNWTKMRTRKISCNNMSFYWGWSQLLPANLLILNSCSEWEVAQLGTVWCTEKLLLTVIPNNHSVLFQLWKSYMT